MLGYLLLLIAQVEFKDALLPKANSKSEIKEAIGSGLSPPCILYKVFYSFPVEQRVKPAELTVALHGEDLELRFNCEIMEGMCECILYRLKILTQKIAYSTRVLVRVDIYSYE